ncbi:MAG: type I methionyl aminopeptidase [Chloroflexota bacterium]
MGIILKSEKEIAIMRQAGIIVAEVLRIVSQQVKPGMKTKELDIIAERELKKRGARSSFKGYRGFPANLCVSVNDEIVHGIPGDRVLKNGDVVSLDFGVIYEGFQGDAAVTVPVGDASPEARRLIATTREALESGIAAARAGATLGDVSAAIQDYAEARGYSVVREYTGHGIGREMHEEPQIPNCTEPPYGLKPGMGPVLKKGMTLAFEPMLNTGDWHTRVAADRWTVLTADGGLSAHFEHTIAIDDTEPEVLTKGVYA